MRTEQEPNSFDLQLNKIEMVEAVAKLGSISAASKVLGISCQAVTRGIRSVEESLNIVLFNHAKSGLVPTKFVIPFLKYGSQILHAVETTEVDLLKKNFGLQAEQESQSLRIAAGMRSCHLWINEALGKVSLQYPGMSISLDHDLLHLYRRILHNDIDIGITMRVLLPPILDGVRIQRLGFWRAYFVCRADHPLTKRNSLNISDLRHFPLAGDYNLPVLMRVFESSHFDGGQFKSNPGWLMSATQVDDLEQTLNMIKTSDHIGIMPYETIADGLNTGDLVKLDISGFLDLDLEVVFVCSDKDHAEPLADFIATVLEIEQNRHKTTSQC